MKKMIFTLFLVCSPSFANVTDPAKYVGDPIPFFSETNFEVKSLYPNSVLLFIGSFSQSKPDPGCSQIGWQFIYQDDQTEQGIRKSFRQKKQANGNCAYISDSSLGVSPGDYPIFGFQNIEGKLDRIKISFNEAKDIAEKTVGNGFYGEWIKLWTPLHPISNGRIFWDFEGPVVCNKGAHIAIDAQTGIVEYKFSNIPNC